MAAATRNTFYFVAHHLLDEDGRALGIDHWIPDSELATPVAAHRVNVVQGSHES